MQDKSVMDLVSETEDRNVTKVEKKAFIKKAQKALRAIIEIKWSTRMTTDVDSEV